MRPLLLYSTHYLLSTFTVLRTCTYGVSTHALPAYGGQGTSNALSNDRGSFTGMPPMTTITDKWGDLFRSVFFAVGSCIAVGSGHRQIRMLARLRMARFTLIMMM